MRDRRFVAVHRGGPLDAVRHHLLAAWAADCAERLLPLFEARSRDNRPRRAVQTAQAWVRGEVSVGACMKAALGAPRGGPAGDERAGHRGGASRGPRSSDRPRRRPQLGGRDLRAKGNRSKRRLNRSRKGLAARTASRRSARVGGVGARTTPHQPLNALRCVGKLRHLFNG